MTTAELNAILPAHPAADANDPTEIRRRVNMWAMWGTAACVQKLGRRWTLAWEWPVSYKTKREAMEAVGRYVLAVEHD